MIFQYGQSNHETKIDQFPAEASPACANWSTIRFGGSLPAGYRFPDFLSARLWRLSLNQLLHLRESDGSVMNGGTAQMVAVVIMSLSIQQKYLNVDKNYQCVIASYKTK